MERAKTNIDVYIQMSLYLTLMNFIPCELSSLPLCDWLPIGHATCIHDRPSKPIITTPGRTDSYHHSGESSQHSQYQDAKHRGSGGRDHLLQITSRRHNSTLQHGRAQYDKAWRNNTAFTEPLFEVGPSVPARLHGRYCVGVSHCQTHNRSRALTPRRGQAPVGSIRGAYLVYNQTGVVP